MPYTTDPLSPEASRPTLRLGRQCVDARHYVIVLAGELDMQTAVDLRSEISAILEQQPAPKQVEVDLADVTFVDSLGLGTLVVGHRICAHLGVRLTVRNPSPFVARLLDVSGFGEKLTNATASM